MIDPIELAGRFKFYPASGPARQADHAQVRKLCGDLAQSLNDVVPDGREKALAMTKLEEVMMWANAGIARQGDAE